MKTQLLLGCALLAGCGHHATSASAPKTPVADANAAPAPAPRTMADAREQPPASYAAKTAPFPPIHHTTLANGMELATVEGHALPVVHLRVFVRAGAGYGAPPGVSTMTAEMLKDGGTRALTSAQLLERVEGLGAGLGVETSFDGTTLSIAVVKEHLEEALRLLADVVTTPRFDEGEFKKLKDRESNEARDRAKTSGAWTASHVVFRELFADANPYASYGATAADIANVTLARVRDYHKRFYVPRNTTLVVAGDVDEPALAKSVAAAFGGWKGGGGGEAPRVEFPPAIALGKTHVIVADRPKSAQSDVYVAMLAPPRAAPDWPTVRVANQILGGGVASRLFTDVREARSLAYNTRSSVYELANGPEPLVAYAGTQTPKTALAVQGLLDNLARMQKEPVTAAETESARRYLSDIFAVRMETIGAIADMVVSQVNLKLPDGYWDSYRSAVRATTDAQASAMAARLFTADKALIVVSGDAEQIAPGLTRFGDVTIVDPESEFKTTRTMPATAPTPTPTP